MLLRDVERARRRRPWLVLGEERIAPAAEALTLQSMVGGAELPNVA